MKTIVLKFLFTVSIWKFILYSNLSLISILFLVIVYEFSLFYSMWPLFKYLKAESKLFSDWTLLRLWSLGPSSCPELSQSTFVPQDCLNEKISLELQRLWKEWQATSSLCPQDWKNAINKKAHLSWLFTHKLQGMQTGWNHFSYENWLFPTDCGVFLNLLSFQG